MNYNRGDIVIVPFPTSQVPEDLKETEMIIEPTPTNGLVKKSTLRLEFLMTIPSELVSRRIGSLTSQEEEELNLKIARSLGLGK